MAEKKTAVNRPAKDKAAVNEDLKEWTVMFYFAGDSASLSPLIVSQLKEIKDAGFHPDVDVLAYFDSNAAGVPAKFLNVNRKRKEEMKASKPSRPFMIGDNRDPFIRDMEDDTITEKDIKNPEDGSASAHVLASIGKADSVNALGGLQNFIGFCREKHTAKNYILFLVGHGLVVGHDSFLPDDNPASSVKLSELGKALEDFNGKDDLGTLQLLALHSCSMSAVEVAYELRGQAKYMMASEGTSYIGSWPYRQLLIKLFRNVVRMKGGDPDACDECDDVTKRSANRGRGESVQGLIKKLFFLSFFNAKDFELCGYSLELSLCSLDPDNYVPLTDKIGGLVKKMRAALKEKSVRGQMIKELILLAHWESQSYWNESYTDLFDFCKCLKKRCDSLLKMLKENTNAAKTGKLRDGLDGLSKSCSDVMDVLSENRSPKLAKRYGPVVILSKHSGPLYQYSHGLSVYFPWSRPVDDGPPTHVCVPREGEQVEEMSAEEIMVTYGKYLFNDALTKAKGESWADFLETYFTETQRETRRTEDGKPGRKSTKRHGSILFNHFGTFAGNQMAALTKGAPSYGGDCDCGSIKNYPAEAVTVAGKTRLLKDC